MEDPELEWEIQKHPSSKEGENTKVRWILNKGLGFGKKVVITGIAISSAPLVLPPLVIISAIGFAFSVPFGFVFASYACTEKLMTKLLPIPKPIPMLEYYTDEDEGEEEEEEDDFKRESAMLEEEKEQMEDIKLGVEMRIELDEGDDYRQKEEEHYTQEEVDNGYEEVPSITNVDEEGYEEDVSEYLKGDDNPLEGIEEREENEEPSADMHQVVILVKGIEENNFNAREVEEIDLEAREVKGDNGKEEKVIELVEEEVVRESTGLLEKSPDEVNGDNALEDDSFGVNESNGVEIEEDPGMEKKATESEEEEVVRESTVLLGKSGDEANADNGLEDNSFGVNESSIKVTQPVKVVEEVDCHILVREGSKDEEPLDVMHRIVVVVGGNDEGNGKAREVEELHLVVREVKKDSGTEEKIAESEEEEIVKGSTGLLEKIRDEGNIVEDNSFGVSGSHQMKPEPVKGSFADENVVVLNKISGEMEGKVEEERDDVMTSEEHEQAMEETKTPLQEEEDVRFEKVFEKTKVANGEKEKVLEENRMPETRNRENDHVPYKVKQVGEEEDGTILGNGKNAKSAYNIVDLNRTENVTSLGANLDRIVEVQKKPLLKEQVIMQGGRAKEGSDTDVHEDIILTRKKENIILTNADAREIADECGFDLFDERNAGTDQNTYTDFESLEANGVVKENTAEVSVDFLELHTSLRVPEYAKIVSETKMAKVPSSEAFFKIWEQIDAMRAIVGIQSCTSTNLYSGIKGALHIHWS